MANKPDYVDLIGDATRQHRRRPKPLRLVAPPEIETSKLSHWPPAFIKQWKLEALAGWKSAARLRLRNWLQPKAPS